MGLWVVRCIVHIDIYTYTWLRIEHPARAARRKTPELKCTYMDMDMDMDMDAFTYSHASHQARRRRKRPALA